MARAGSIAALLAAIQGAGARADPADGSIAVKRGMQAIFAATIADGRVTLGAPRFAPVGTIPPENGEIAIGIAPGGLTPYATLHLVEKTAAPVDFVATGFIDRIRIDEIVVCGRLDRPVAERIAAGSLRIVARDFTVGTGVDTCK